MADDMFDDLFNLEDTYYQDGYRLGVEDGSRAGRIEGRTFGLEKGYEKFFEMGKLHGTSKVLLARLPDSLRNEDGKSLEHDKVLDDHIESNATVRELPSNERLAKHIRTLFALTELESLSTSNGEDEVSEFDDRMKRAAAKAKVIENIVGERNVDSPASSSTTNGAPAKSNGASGVKLSRATATEKNIEDFGVGRARGSG